MLTIALSMLLLTSCSVETVEPFKQYFEYQDGLPVVYNAVSPTRKTYLMMSRYGYVNVLDDNGEVTKLFGQTVASEYLEYTIMWQDNGKLPEKKDVGTTVSGASFKGWAFYTDNVVPEYVTVAPDDDGARVYAIFEGTDAGGNQGGGGGGQTGDTFQEGIPYIVGTRDYSTGTATGSAGDYWNDVTKAYPMTESSPDPAYTSQVKADITFEEGDIWKIRIGSSDWLQDNNYESGGAIDKGQMGKESDGYGGTNVVVKEAGTYRIYFKTYEGGWRSMYVEKL